jgi:ABC-type nitrate/sulfonate/bicarbonate transport system substrate-binding protein
LLRALPLAAAGLTLARHARAADDAIRVAFPSGMNGQFVVTIERAGLAQQSGLGASFVPFQYGPPMMEALAAGSIDAVVTSLMPVTSYASRLPGDIQIAGMLGNSSHSLIVRAAGPIAKPDDLAGKTVGVSFGSDSHLDLLIWLRQSGLSGKATLANIPPAELSTALLNGSVDAIVIRQPQVAQLLEGSTYRALKTWPFHFVTAIKRSFMRDHPATVGRYLETLKRSIVYASQHREETAKWFGEFLKVDPAVVAKAVEADRDRNPALTGEPDLAVDEAAKRMIAKWITDAFDEHLIRKRFEVDALL